MKDTIDGRAALGALSLAFRHGGFPLPQWRRPSIRSLRRSSAIASHMSPSPPRSTGPTSSDDGHLAGVRLWLGIGSVAGPNVCCNFDNFGRISAAEMFGRFIGEFL